MTATFCSVQAQTFVEQLSRGVVAVNTTAGNFVSWRLLDSDATGTTFNLLRDGEVIASNIADVTNFTDATGTSSSQYSVQTVVAGSITETSDEVQPWDKPYLSVPLIRPSEVEMPDGTTCTYTPNDCSAADVDGDGDYEIILKWDPSNAHDNSHSGYTAETYLDCYKPEGILLWRIALGNNIRSGAHYTQFMVYDLDGDGKAEVVCKTAPGSKDGRGDYVTLAATDETIRNADNTADYRNEGGHVIQGPEYLTVFNGKNGKALHTIYYNPNRAFTLGGAPEIAEEWGDVYGNRSERYLACVAFLGGKTQNPSVVMCRGYYTRSYLWAVDFDGKQLTQRWLHESISPSQWNLYGADNVLKDSRSGLPSTAYAQGAHSIAVGDVDGDGCDEITYGAAAIDNDGTLLYSTALGHGDAQHLTDLDPDRPGLEYFMPHEQKPYGVSLRDARTGEILYREYDSDDTGRGLAADIDSLHRGCEFWSTASKDIHAIDGTVIATTEKWIPANFRIYWDGDLYDELLGNGRGQMPGTVTGNEEQMPDSLRQFPGGMGQFPQGMRPDMPDSLRQCPGGMGQSPQGMRPDMPDSLRQRMEAMRQRGEFPQMDGQRQRGERGNMQQSRRDMSQNGQHFAQGQQRNGRRGGRGGFTTGRQSYWIGKWNGNGVDEIKTDGKVLSDYGNSQPCNGTKATPCLQADLFGDWREEVILYDDSDKAHLNIFTTTIPSQYRVVTPMQDHIYRMGVVWQNVSYNQPPHLGYYLPDAVKEGKVCKR